jgi:hypothetical protein
MVAYSGSGIETTFTQGEDNCLAELARSCQRPRRAPPARRRHPVGRGGRPVRRLFDELGIGPVALPAGAPRRRCARVGPGTRLLPRPAVLTETVAALTSRGAELLAAPYPLGAEGTRAWLQAAADAFGVNPDAFDEVVAAPARPARGAPSPHSEKRWPASASASCPTPSWRCRWRASCSASAAMQVTSRGDALPRPACSWPRSRNSLFDPARTHHRGRRRLRSASTVRDERPDLTVCGLGIANPLEAEGLRTKWSIELIFSPIQGFEQAGDLAELFAVRCCARRNGWRSEAHGADRLDLRRPAARRRHAHRELHARRAPVLHAPQGDTYADLLFTMIERDETARRSPTRPSRRAISAATRRSWCSAPCATPASASAEVLLVGDSCTAELLQDQPGALATSMACHVPMSRWRCPAYSRKENWGAAETFYTLVRGLLQRRAPRTGRDPGREGRARA